jgi:hypothetical protein
MPFVAPFKCLERWLVPHTDGDTGRITCLFDDFVDILRGIVVGVPVDDGFYRETYPGVARRLEVAGYSSFHDHFTRDGYFEGRQPFQMGPNGLAPPPTFNELVKSVSILPNGQGRLSVEFTRSHLMTLVTKLLKAVPVDENWYVETYSDAAKAIETGEYASAADHYCCHGYFDGHFPNYISVDAEWYVGHYGHVSRGLSLGVATSAQDHFLRIGYNEGCRPVPP